MLRPGLEQRAPLDGGLEGGEGVARRAVQVGVLVDELEHECALRMRRAHGREKQGLSAGSWQSSRVASGEVARRPAPKALQRGHDERRTSAFGAASSHSRRLRRRGSE